MPLAIDGNRQFGNVDEISLNAFKPTDGSDGFTNATIAVGGKTFNVAFADDGKVSVSFATTSFFHLFQGSAKTAVRAKIEELVALNSVVKDVATAVHATGSAENTVAVINRAAAKIGSAYNGNFAFYGFSDVRDATRLAIGELKTKAEAEGKTPPQRMLINSLNESIGLDERITVATTIAFVRDNDKDAWKHCGIREIGPEDQRAWQSFLKGHDVDLFSKIRKAQAEATAGKTTGWAGEINRHGLESAVLDMVRKNIDPRVLARNPDVNFVMVGVAKAVMEIAATDFTGKTEAAIDERLHEIVAQHAPRGKEKAAYDIFQSAATGAFWRQTSKLGLDFFKARGQTVVFEWTKYNGERTDETELADTWWKNAGERVGDHHGVAITNSEMRHLQSKKYADKAGTGEVLKVAGALSQTDAEAAVQQKIESLKAMPAAELKAILDDLKAGFAGMQAKDFKGTAHFLFQTLPNASSPAGVIVGPYFQDTGLEAIKNSFARLQAKIAAAPSPLVQVAMLSNLERLFEAELLQDPIVRDLVDAPSAAPAQEADAGAVALRTLAGLDRGYGVNAFFASDTGEPNALGNILLREARANGSDVASLANELKQAFAEKLDCKPEEATRHAAFKTFLVRAAASKWDFASLLTTLDTVKAAHEAKETVAKVFDKDATLSPAERKAVARRGDWDLNRLVFNAVLKAGAEEKPVDKTRLEHTAEVIKGLCKSAVAFAAAVEQEVGVAFSEAERDRLIDSYLDREASSIKNYRLNGDADNEAKLPAEHATILARTRALVTTLGELARDYLPAQTVQSKAALKAMVIGGVAGRAGDPHAILAVATLKAALQDEPVSLTNGATKGARVANFAQTLADRVRRAFDLAYAGLPKAQQNDLGFDDLDTATRMFFLAYVAEHPQAGAFLDESLDADAYARLKQMSDRESKDTVGKHLGNVLQTYSQL